MMKKKTVTRTRLVFRTETIRTLVQQDLAWVAGAITGTRCVQSGMPCANNTHPNVSDCY